MSLVLDKENVIYGGKTKMKGLLVTCSISGTKNVNPKS